jgi:hypothetical protein
MRGSRRSRARFAALAGCAVVGALLVAPTGASAANPPACDTSVYPTPFLIIDGSTFRRNTRFLEMRQNPRSTDKPSGDADPEYPFPLRVDRTKHASRTFTVHDYAKDQFAVTFNRPETAFARATYVEVHTEYIGIATIFVRCTRVVTKTFKAPPKPKPPPGGGGGNGGRGDDPED